MNVFPLRQLVCTHGHLAAVVNAVKNLTSTHTDNAHRAKTRGRKNESAAQRKRQIEATLTAQEPSVHGSSLHRATEAVCVHAANRWAEVG